MSGLSRLPRVSLPTSRHIGYIVPSTSVIAPCDVVCFPAEAEQDCGIIERSNGMKVRVMADWDGWQCVENEDYRSRSAQEIARLSQ